MNFKKEENKMKFLHEYLKSPNGTILEDYYWEIRGNRLYNAAGGFHFYHPKEDDEIIESTWDDILYKQAIKKLDPSKITGWIAPDGTFYGCDYQDHWRVAEIILNSSERDLEEHGYCRIYYNPLYGETGESKYSYYYEKHLTEAQIDVLISKGLEIKH